MEYKKNGNFGAIKNNDIYRSLDKIIPNKTLSL